MTIANLPPGTAKFATCDLCDNHKNDTSGAFRVLAPVFRSFGGVHKFSGPVTTVKCFEDNSQVKAAVESSGLGRVLVVDGGGSLRRALLGGNLGAAAAEAEEEIVVEPRVGEHTDRAPALQTSQHRVFANRRACAVPLG